MCLAALSVVAALGLLSYMYTTLKAIPVIIELVPILGLTIGTSNLFILINICEVSNVIIPLQLYYQCTHGFIPVSLYREG